MSKSMRILNINKTQQHPFHVMHSSKLPMFLSLFAGCTALLFVAKLHADSSADTFTGIAVLSQLLSPFFEVNGLSYLSLNSFVLFGLISGVITMAS